MYVGMGVSGGWMDGWVFGHGRFCSIALSNRERDAPERGEDGVDERDDGLDLERLPHELGEGGDLRGEHLCEGGRKEGRNGEE